MIGRERDTPLNRAADATAALGATLWVAALVGLSLLGGCVDGALHATSAPISATANLTTQQL